MWLECRLKTFMLVLPSILIQPGGALEVPKVRQRTLVSFEQLTTTDAHAPLQKQMRRPLSLQRIAAQGNATLSSHGTKSSGSSNSISSAASAQDPAATTAVPTTTVTTTTFDGVAIKVVIAGAPLGAELETSPKAAASSLKTAWSTPTGDLKEHLTKSGWDGSQLPAAVIAGGAVAVTNAPTVTTTTKAYPTTSQAANASTTAAANVAASSDEEAVATTAPPITTKEFPTTTGKPTEAADQGAPAEPPQVGTLAPPEKVAEYKTIDGESVPCSDGVCTTSDGFVPDPDVAR